MRAMEASGHTSSKQVLRFPEKIINWHCAESNTVWETVTLEKKNIVKSDFFGLWNGSFVNYFHE